MKDMKKQRSSRMVYKCDLCSSSIHIGEKYYQWKGHRAHVACPVVQCDCLWCQIRRINPACLPLVRALIELHKEKK